MRPVEARDHPLPWQDVLVDVALRRPVVLPGHRHFSLSVGANKVIGFVRGLREQGVTAIFISHNMHHVFACCDRIVAMALGKIVLDKPIGETSIEEVQDML